MEALLIDRFNQNKITIKQRTTMKAVKVNHTSSRLTNDEVLKITLTAIEKKISRDQENVQGWMKQLISDFNIRLKYVAEDLFVTNLAIHDMLLWKQFIIDMRFGEVKQDAEQMTHLQMVIRLTRELKKHRLSNQRRILSNTNLHNSTGYLHNAENLWIDSYQKLYIVWLTDIINLIISSMQLSSSIEDNITFTEQINLNNEGVF